MTSIPIGETILPCDFMLPPTPCGIVIFAHGSGSSRFSPRNVQVARALNQAGLGTLLFDLLTETEAQDRGLVFDIPFLATRLRQATTWLKDQPEAQGLPLGYFGASTGAAAALWAAADLKEDIQAIVSRGGRPDLASSRLKEVTAKTLLLVGSHDEPVLVLNRKILPLLKNAKLVIIPGASHLFEELGMLDAIAHHAEQWFLAHFRDFGEIKPRMAA